MFQLPAAGTSWASTLWVEVAFVMVGTFLSICRNGLTPSLTLSQVNYFQ